MNSIKKIFLLIKNLFYKEKVKMIGYTYEISTKEEKKRFVEFLKEEATKKKKIETLICVGDGLGIQRKITY